MNNRQKRPFIKKFKTEKNNYIYDVNTNEFLQIDNITYDIIDFYKVMDISDIINKFKSKYNEKEIKRIHNLMDKTAADGKYFSSHRPKGLRFDLSKEQLEKALNNSLTQLILYITEQCNMRCKYCVLSDSYYYYQTYSSTFMRFETAKRAVDYFLQHSTSESRMGISFYGGEPLLNAELIKSVAEYVVRDLKINNLNFNMTTNGTALNESIIQFLIDYDFGLLVSLDGPENVNDRNRVFTNKKGTYKTIIKNLERIKELNESYYKRKVRINPTLSPPYEIDEVQKFFDSNDLFKNKVKFSSVQTFQTNYFNKFDKKVIFEQEKAMRIWLEKKYKMWLKSDKSSNTIYSDFYKNKMWSLFNRPITRLGDYVYPGGQCIIGQRKFVVDPEGQFYICDKIPHSISIGNITTGLNANTIYNLLKEYCSFSEKMCCNCWAVRLCKTCMKYKLKGTAFDNKSTKNMCKSIRNSLEKDLRFFCSVMEENQTAFDYLHNIYRT